MILKIFILFFLCFGFWSKLNATGYDSTFVLSIKQKFAIPEDVMNNDDVGTWQKTVTWRSGNEVKFSIHRNFKAAFVIDSLSGLIKIKDASKVKGKIFQQDTLIIIIVRSIDSRLGFEDDTCEIRVKESRFCRFIDYNSNEKGSGTRTKPWTDLPESGLKAGYAYFIKRDNRPLQKTYLIPPFQAGYRHPVIIGAYDLGKNPLFDGTGLPPGSTAFEFMNVPLPSRYCYIYNINVANYSSMAFRISTRCSNFGIYNCNFLNNVNTDYKAGLADIYFFGDPADTLTNWNHELINLKSEGSWGPILKADASGIKASNIMSATANQTFNFRFAISYYSSLSHFWFIGGKRSLQMRYPFITIRDGILESSAEAGIYLVTNEKFAGKPDNLLIDNVLFRSNTYGIYVYNSNINNTTIKNCRFDYNQMDGIYFRNGGNNRDIRNCTFINNGNHGLELSTNSFPSSNVEIAYNLFYGNRNKAINASKSLSVNNIKIINNTIIGAVDLSGSTDQLVINNFYKSLFGASKSSSNIIIDSITMSEYFKDPERLDFHLKNTATRAIGKGTNNSLKRGAIQQKAPDIGAFNYE